MPDAPALVTVPNVELVKAGTWVTSTGEFTWSSDDLAAAVEAQDDPAVPTPIVKLGHIDPRFDGEPAVGRVANLRLSEDRMTLIGDFVGVPGWLGQVMGSAYPSRSVEGWFKWTGATGVNHDFVLTSVALLGVIAPAVEGLEDIKALYDVDQVAASRPPAEGTAVTVTFKEGTVPRPVAASVNLDDVRTEFYETQPPGSWAWVREVWSDFIIVDNDEGDLFRIPWTEEPEGDVQFGTPERVVVEYVPAPTDDDETTSTLALAARYVPKGGLQVAATNVRASRRSPRLRGPRHTVSASGPEGPTQGGSMDLVQLRTTLGLAEDTTDAQVIDSLVAAAEYAAAERDALRTASTAQTPPPAAPELPEGVVAIDAAQLEELKVAASAGATARAEQIRQERDRFLGEAVKAGKFPPARKAHFEALYDKDPDGTREFVDKTLAAGAVPVSELGTALGGDESNDDDAFFARIAPGFVEAAKQ